MATKSRGAAKGVSGPGFLQCQVSHRPGWTGGGGFASQDLTRGIGRPAKAGPCKSAIRSWKSWFAKRARNYWRTGDAVAGIEDMGAAGLTCSTCETRSAASTGIEIELSEALVNAISPT